MVERKNCHSARIVKSGWMREKQRYKCKEGGARFVEGDARTSDKIAALKAPCVVLYSLGQGSCDRFGKRLGRNRSLTDRWIREAGFRIAEPEIDGEITRIEFDELWHFMESKKELLIQAVNRGSRRAIAWSLGGRESVTLRRLRDEVKHGKDRMFHMDKWEAFMEVPPPERHVIGQSGTWAIETTATHGIIGGGDSRDEPRSSRRAKEWWS